MELVITHYFQFNSCKNNLELSSEASLGDEIVRHRRTLKCIFKNNAGSSVWYSFVFSCIVVCHEAATTILAEIGKVHSRRNLLRVQPWNRLRDNRWNSRLKFRVMGRRTKGKPRKNELPLFRYPELLMYSSNKKWSLLIILYWSSNKNFWRRRKIPKKLFSLVVLSKWSKYNGHRWKKKKIQEKLKKITRIKILFYISVLNNTWKKIKIHALWLYRVKFRRVKI